jgi:hypothetical protein
MPRFRKRPVEVEAIRWTGDNDTELIAFTGNRFAVVAPEDRGDDPDYTAEVFDILHSTWIGVYTRHWIVKGIKGECYPCDDSVFHSTYEEV